MSYNYGFGDQEDMYDDGMVFLWPTLHSYIKERKGRGNGDLRIPVISNRTKENLCQKSGIYIPKICGT